MEIAAETASPRSPAPAFSVIVADDGIWATHQRAALTLAPAAASRSAAVRGEDARSAR